MKMIVTDQIKILDRKIMQNEVQYDLDRKAAKVLLNKLNLSILHWVKFLTKGWIEMIRKKDRFRD